jgi:hypothetical protein
MKPLEIVIITVMILVLIWYTTDSEASEVSIGTISRSYHVDKSNNPNEKHNGLLVNINGLVIGSFINSDSNESILVGYERQFHRWKDLAFSWTIGVADGYEENTDSHNGYLILGAVNFDYTLFRVYDTTEVKARLAAAWQVYYTGLQIQFH